MADREAMPAGAADRDDLSDIADTGAERHPRFFAWPIVLVVVPLCVLGSLIGTQLLVRLGVTTNTAVIGALAGMGLGRLPVTSLRIFRSVHVQNLVQSAVSASTFAAANSLLLPIGIPFVLGRSDLVLPMLLGAAAAMLLDATLLYRMFGTTLFPAHGAWPPGVAAAETIAAGDQGGRRIVLLAGGAVLGAAGSLFGVPMSGFGVAFIGNAAALTAFGIGLLVAGSFGGLEHWLPFLHGIVAHGDLGHSEIPKGIMLGAGIAALIQVAVSFASGRGSAAGTGGQATPGNGRTMRQTGTRKADGGPVPAATLAAGWGLYLLIAAAVALVGGLEHEMSVGLLVAFVLYAAVAALLHELIVGLAAMHSGWFPAFAVAVVSLGVGLLIGFPAAPLALLTGFTASTGPAFADMGCDLKAGFLLREGRDARFEADGRWQQYLAALTAMVVAIVVVSASFEFYFAAGKVAPVDRTFVAAIKAGSDPAIARALLLWAIPGALLQLAGGSKRQIGVLFATGLLLASPLAGIAVMAGIACRAIWLSVSGETARPVMQVSAAGTIAGDTLASFATALL